MTSLLRPLLGRSRSEQIQRIRTLSTFCSKANPTFVANRRRQAPLHLSQQNDILSSTANASSPLRPTRKIRTNSHIIINNQDNLLLLLRQSHHLSHPVKAYFHSTTMSSADAAASPATDEAAVADTTAPVAADGDEGDEEAKISDNDIVWQFTPPAPLSEESQKKVDDLFNEILWLDMIEVHLLTEVINEKMGYGGMDMGGDDFDVGASGAGGVDGVQEEAQEEKTIFELKLVGFDAKAKIKVIKEVRAITGLGLKEAKEMVENAPKIVQKDLKKDKAEELKSQLEAIGAQVEIE